MIEWTLDKCERIAYADHMSKASWVIDVATNINETVLNWFQLSIPGMILEFPEGARKSADDTVIRLSLLYSDQLIFRVRHTNSNRGSFYPCPRPARILKGDSL